MKGGEGFGSYAVSEKVRRQSRDEGESYNDSVKERA